MVRLPLPFHHVASALYIYTRLHPGVERFMRDHPQAVGQPMDIEDLNRLGANHRCCPYYLSRETATEADLVLLPYNYLLDSRIDKPNLKWQGAVVIFDEAHNMEEVCAASASFDLPAAVIAAAIEETQQAATLARQRCELLLQRPEMRTQQGVLAARGEFAWSLSHVA